MASAAAGAAGKDTKVFGLFKLPFRKPSPASTSGSPINHAQSHSQQQSQGQNPPGPRKVSTVVRSFLPTPRRLKLDPAKRLYFPYEPGKQVRSAIKIKNTSKSLVAFKFQTTSPKSCFMRPPGAVLAPGKSIIATVFKFVEPPENNEKPNQRLQSSKVKFKIMSLKVKGDMEYKPELFEEQSDQIAKEQILQVVFLDAGRPTAALEKLKRQLAEADAAAEASKKPAKDADPQFIGEGLVVDEWKERRERYLAQQNAGSVESI
ncbi:vesicle-associated protein 4-2-like [Ipomoea triloba]|uniref:vesicle-associated protein 4-2-like n=1 Tax=Ipomoea triloba TaxID=35885 RepID=UPI00125E4542|nr:vesicle-associated protein 4-2-like [Ipomoea triloba]